MSLLRWFGNPKKKNSHRRKPLRPAFDILERRELPAAFTVGDLVIDRVGDGSTALSGAALPVSLVEVQTNGTLTGNVIAIPNSTSSENVGGITDSGTATSNGFLNLSADGYYLSLIGYDAHVGFASVTGSTAAAVNRNVAAIDGAGNVSVVAQLTDAFSGNPARSAVSATATTFYVGGTSNVRYFDATSSVPTTSTNITSSFTARDVIIAQDNSTSQFLLASTQTSVSYYSGFPTSSQTPTSLGLTLTDANAFILFDRQAGVGATGLGGLDTLYVADGSSIGATGTAILRKFEWNGSAWTAQGTATLATSGSKLFGLTGRIAGDGGVELYATTQISSNNSLVSFVDSTNSNAFGGSISGSLTTLASAGANYAFRGVAFAPSGLTIGSTVWHDQDADGVQDASEPGVAGAVVELYRSTNGTMGDSDDVSLGTRITDSSGSYQFSGIGPQSNYYLVFRPPVGMSFTTQDQGGNDALDSDADPSTGRTAFFAVGTTNDSSRDAGLTGALPSFGFALKVGATGNISDSGRAIAVDAQGSVYITGEFKTNAGPADFDPGPGQVNLTAASTSNDDIYVAKYSSKGALVWVRQFGASVGDRGQGIAVDNSGNVYVTGYFEGTIDFDSSIVGTTSLTSAGGTDVFVLKLDSNGNFGWVHQRGSVNDDQGAALAVDGSGNVYFTGFIGNATAGSRDILISKLNNSGAAVWTKQPTGANDDGGLAIALDSANNVYVTGFFVSTTTFGSALTALGQDDAFVSKLDNSGTFIWTRQMGGGNSDKGAGITVDGSGNVYTTGYFDTSADFGTTTVPSNGGKDVFVSKLNSAGSFVWTQAMGGSSDDFGTGIVRSASGNLYTTGYFTGTADFDPTGSTPNLISAGSDDVFISVLDSSGNFVSAQQLGGTNTDDGLAIALTSAGDVYVTGNFKGTADFDPRSSSTYNLTASGTQSDLFLSKINGPNTAPTDIALSNSSIAENTDTSGGDVLIGSLSSTDADAGDTFTYALVSGTGSADNGSFTISGNQLKVKQGTTLDFETKSSYAIRISSTDSGSLSVEKEFTISVTDANETPTANGQTASGTEDRDLPITLTGDDGDPGLTQTLTFTITTLPSAGALYQTPDGTTRGAQITVANTAVTDTQGRVIFAPAANAFGSPYTTFTFTVTDDNSAGPALTSSPATVTINISTVADTPSGTSASTNEDAQTTSGLVISRNVADGNEVTHFKITLLANGTLFKSDGTTPITLGEFITVAEGQAGLKFSPDANENDSTSSFRVGVQASLSASEAGLGGGIVNVGILVTPVNDEPDITIAGNQTVNEDAGAQSVANFATGFVRGGGADENGQQILDFLVSNNNNGLFSVQPDVANDGTLTYTPAAGISGSATVSVQVQDNGGILNSGDDTSQIKTFTITVNAVGDTPSVSNATTLEDTQTSSGLVITPAAGDQATHFKITNIQNGLLFQSDGTTPIVAGQFITVAEGQAGLKFSPDANENDSTPSLFRFDIQASLSAGDAGLGGSVITASISVTPVNDEPDITIGGNQTVNEDAGLQTVAAFATSFVRGGGADENAQQILDFLVSNNNNGLFSGQPDIANDGTLTYTPAAGVSGSATVSVQVQDDGGTLGGGDNTSQVKTFTITVNAVADTPAASTASTLEDTQSSSGLVITPAAGDQATHFKITNLQNGLLFKSDGSTPITAGQFITIAEGQAGLKFSPDANENDSTPSLFGFNIQASLSASDAGLGGSVATASINVTPVNDEPDIAIAGNQTVNEDAGAQSVASFATGFVRGGGSDENSQQIFDFLVGNNNNGLFSVQPDIANDGTLTYTPAAGVSGSATVSVQVQDNGGILNGGDNTSQIKTFTITVHAVADAPSASNATTLEDTQTSSGLVITPAASDQATHFKITNIQNGLLFKSDGTSPILAGEFITIAEGQAGLRFSPDANENDSTPSLFRFDIQASLSASDAGLGGSVVTASISVTPVNDEPDISIGGNQTVNEDAGLQTSANFATGFVRGGGADENGQQIFDFLVSNNNNALFSAQPDIANDGTLTYTPAAGVSGSATVSVQVQDDGGILNGGDDTSQVKTFTITVNAVADTPSANNATTLEDTQTSSGLVITPAAGDQATHFKITNIQNGSLFQSDGTTPITAGQFITVAEGQAGLKFSPDANENDSTPSLFRFDIQASLSASDAGLGGSVATASISVTAVNDEPDITIGGNQTVNEDAGLQSVTNFATGFVRGGGVDENGQQIFDFLVSNNNNALFSVQPDIANDGTLTYTPAAGVSGSATVSVQVQDDGDTLNGGDNTSQIKTFTITVSAAADTPNAANATTLEDTQTSSGLVITPAAGDQATHFKITNIQNGLLFQSDGTTPITAGQFITVAEGQAGLKFSPDANENDSTPSLFRFDIQASLSASDAGLGGSVATASISVTPVNDEPDISVAGNQTVNEDAGAQSVASFATGFVRGGGADENSQQIFDFLVSNNNSALFSAQPDIANDGTLTYTPAAGVSGSATVSVQVQDDGDTLNGGDNTSPIKTFTITVSAAADTPSAANATTLEDTQTSSGVVITPAAGDQATHFKITNIQNGLLFKSDGTTPITAGQFITVAEGQAGLKFSPDANENDSTPSLFRFDIQASLSASDAGLGGSVATASISVTPVNDEPNIAIGGTQTVNTAAPQTVSGFATSFVPGGGSDENGQQIADFLVSNDNNALFTVQPDIANDGTLTYQAVDGVHGTVLVSVQVRDNGGTSDGGDNTSPVHTFTIQVFTTLQDKVDAAPTGGTVLIAPGTYSGIVINKDLTLDGQGGGVIIHGASPALTVTSGQVIVQNGVALTTATDDPTVLVQSGGSLTLRTSTVQESTGFDQVAIRVEAGGLLDLGTSGDAGGNVIDISGAGSLIDNQDDTGITALGNTWQQDGVAIGSNFTIEDEIAHALDGAGLGLVRYVANNVYVTTSSGSLQRGIDASSNGDTVNLQGGAFAEAVAVAGNRTLSTSFTVTINSLTSNAGVTLGLAGGWSADGFNLGGPVALYADTTLTATGALGALFSDTINGDGNGPWQLTVASANAVAPLQISGASIGASNALASLTINNAGSAAISAAIAGTGTALGKNGNGTLTLSGSNSYTGATTIAAGTLALSAAATNNISSSQTIEVQSSAILDVTGLTSGTLVLASGQTLKGNGTVTGDLSVASGAAIAPGTSPGVISSGSVTFSSGSSFDVEIDGTNGPGLSGGHDQLVVTGTVDLGGATLNLSGLIASTAAGDAFVLIDNDDSDAITGTFAGLAQGDTITFNSRGFCIVYTGGDGNDVVLVATGTAGGSMAGAYVNEDWAALDFGVDPDGVGPAAAFGIDAFATIQDGIDALVGDGSGVLYVLGSNFLTPYAGFDLNKDIQTRFIKDYQFNESILWIDGAITLSADADWVLYDDATFDSTGLFTTTNTTIDAASAGGQSLSLISSTSGVDSVSLEGAIGGTALADATFGTATNYLHQLSFTSALHLAADFDISCYANIVDVGGGSDFKTLGLGSVQLIGVQTASVGGGAAITTEDGGITISGNEVSPQTGITGGVGIGGALTTANGAIQISGQGGDLGGAGIILDASITSTGTGTIALTGVGGTAAFGEPGIQMQNTTISSADGAITIMGTASDGADDTNTGVAVYSNSHIQSTGTATIFINGTGGAGNEDNNGVTIEASGVTSVDGAIQIIGQGGAGTSVTNRGVHVNGGSVTSTGTATITIQGTAGAGLSDNYGVDLDFSSQVTTIDGAISITGQGGAGASGNAGVRLASSLGVSSSGTGTITINGTAGNGTDNNVGVRFENGVPIFLADGNVQVIGIGNGGGTGNHGVYVSNSMFFGTGTGSVTVDGTASSTVGATGNGVNIDSMLFFLDGDVDVSGTGTSGEADIFWNNLALLASGGTKTFEDGVDGGALDVGSGTYGVVFNDGGIIRSSVSFYNSNVTFGDNDSDVMEFDGTLYSPNNNAVRGTVATLDDTMDIGTLFLSGDATLESGTGIIQLGFVDGAHDFAVNSNSFTIFVGQIGFVVRPTSLSTDSGGATLIFAPGDTTANPAFDVNGPIVFGDAVLVGSNVALTSSGDMTFDSTLDAGFGSAGLILTVGAAQTLTFTGAVGNTPLSYLQAEAGGTTAIYGGSVTTSGFQAYYNPILLGGATTLTDNGVGGILIDSTIDSDLDGPWNLTLATSDSSAPLQVNGTMGGTRRIDVLTVDNAGPGTLAGEITGTGTSFIKEGGGALSLTAANTYTGQTTVNNGALLVNNSTGSGTGTGNIVVNSGGTLGGSGTVSGPITVNSGGTLAPGNSPEILNTTNLLLNSDAVLSVEIYGASPGAGGYDQVVVTGAVNVNADGGSGSILNVSMGFVPFIGQQFIIIDNDLGDAILPADPTPKFQGLPESATFTASGFVEFSISYIGGDNNDVVLTVVNFVPATTVYVDDDFSSLSPGDAITDADPVAFGDQLGVVGYSAFATIQAAVNAVADGGLVIINDGEGVAYAESVSITKPLTLEGNGGIFGNDATAVLIDPASGNGITVSLAVADDVTINDLTVGDAADGISVSGVDDFLIHNVRSSANSGHGLAVSSTGSVTINGGTYSNNGGDGLHITGISGAVVQNGVTATGNDPGVYINGAASFSDTDGNFSGNNDHGIQLIDIVGDVTLTRTRLVGNDADNNGTGDGLNITDGVDGDSVGVGGSLVVNGADIRGGNGTGILLIDDQGGFGNVASILTTNGFNVTVVNDEFANGYANLLNGSFLAGFALVVYGERGDGFGVVLPASVAASLENYIQNGGNLLVTGYDTLGSPTDTDLAALVRSVSPGDQVSGDPNWQTANINNFILNGPFGDFRNLAFSATGYDDDVLIPDTAAGAVELASTPGNTSRIIFTDLPGAGGSVGYWNGGQSGTTSDAQPDFEDGANPQNIFLNWVAGTATAASQQHDGIFVSGVGGNVQIDGSTDAVSISGNQNAGISLANIAGDLTLTSVNASGNSSTNVFVDVVLNINVSGGDYSNSSSGNGLNLQNAAGTVQVSGVTASNNGVANVYVNSGISITLTDSTFSGTASESGVIIVNTGPVQATNVTARGNAVHGLQVSGVASLVVAGGDFSVNAADGIHAESISGAVVLQNGVIANGNDPGVYVNGAASFSDTDGVFFGNDDHGIQLIDIAGDVTLTRTRLIGNDADNDSTGDGLNIADGGDGDSVGVGGNLIINGADIRGGNGSVLLIDDQGGFGNVASILTANGFSVTVVNNEFANAYANLLNGSFLAGFALVVYAERGDGNGNALPAAVAASLENYIQNGGNLLVTGYDTLGDPTDTDLAGLVRALSPNDQFSGNPNWQTANINNFILNGPFGDFRNLAFAATGYDDDTLIPDTSAGAVELAATPGNTSRIIFTDLPGTGGSVGYWNGGLSGTTSDAQPDFEDGGNPQNIFLNWAAGTATPLQQRGIFVDGVAVNVTMGATAAVTVTGNSSSGISLQNVTGAVALTDVTADGNGSRGLRVTAAGSVTAVRGSYSGNGSDGIGLGAITGAVQLTDVAANNNGSDGLEVGTAAALAINGTSSFSGNADQGIDIFGSISGAVSLTGVTADNNTNDGLFATNLGSLTISGASSFSGNGDDGIDVTNISGAVSVTGVSAIGNGDDGIDVSSITGAVSLTGVSADGNSSDGLVGTNLGSITIAGGSFSANGGDGIDLTSITGAVVLQNGVVAFGNDPGVFVSGAASFSDTDGIFSGNLDHGIQLIDIAGNVTLTRTKLLGNDADGDGTGDGLNVTDGTDGDSVGIGGSLIIDGATIQGASASNTVLLIDDQGGFGNVASILGANGFAVTVVNNEFANSYANLLNSSFLAGFSLIVYGERGDGFGAVLPAAVAASLENYIQNGGNLLVTGRDTLGAPTDANLAGLVRALSPGDQVSFDPGWQTANINNFILNGVFGDFRNVAFSATGYDDDQLIPDTAAGAVELASIPGVTSRIIFTDLPGAGGTVGYWNGGTDLSDVQPDFEDGGNPQNIFLNWAAGTVHPQQRGIFVDGVAVNVTMGATAAVMVTGNSSSGILLQNVTGAVALTDVTADGNGSRGLRVTTAGAVAVVRGSYSGNGSDGIGLGAITGAVQLTDVAANNNGSDGLEVGTAASLTINGTSSFSGNADQGIDLFTSISGAVSLTGVIADNNGTEGLFATGLGSLTISGASSFSGNSGDGIDVSNITGLVSLAGVTASSNGNYGFQVTTAPTVTISDLTAQNNTVNGGNITNVATVNFNATTTPANIADTVTVQSTQFQHTRTASVQQPVLYSGVTTLNINTLDGADIANVRSTNSATTTNVDTGSGNDTINVSSDAATNNGNLDGIVGALSIQAGTGTANRLIISDFGASAGNNVTVTSTAITGMAPVAINYQATGGNFTNGATNDGILLRGANGFADTFLVTTTLLGSTTKLQGNGGGDTFNVGSTPGANNGQLDLIVGLLAVDAGAGTDTLYLNDRGTALPAKFDYIVTPTSVTSSTVRPFAGVVYNGNVAGNEMENLRLDGTDDVNVFDVKPSLVTEYFIDGNLPPPGVPLPGGGDFLKLDITGTAGWHLHSTGLGEGFWEFHASAHKRVTFESIERFNHVDIIATGTEANRRSLPKVKVYDIDSGVLRGELMPYETFFRGGTRPATGDVNNDGFPDLIVLPGAKRAATMHIYNGAPDANGVIQFTELTNFDVIPALYKFKRGAFPAIGDVNFDGANEVIIGADAGWLPVVGVFNGQTLFSTAPGTAPPMIVPPNSILGDGVNTGYLLADEFRFRGGVRVAAGDLTGDGRAEIIVGRGPGYTPGVRFTTVTVFSGANFGALSVLSPFGAKYNKGVYVAAGDFNGSGTRDVIVGAGPGWVPQIVVYNGMSSSELARVQVYANPFRGGVRVVAKPVNGGNPGSVEQVGVWVAPGQHNKNAVRHAGYAGAALDPSIVDRIFEDGYYASGIFIG